MFLTVDKLKNRTNELGSRRYFNHQNIAPFTSMDGELDKDDHYRGNIPEIKGGTFDKNDFLVGRDKYLWLEKEVELLPEKEGCEVVGLFNFGRTGDGNNSHFESLLYVNDKEYQGVDSNHEEVIFTGLEGKDVNLKFLLWTGLEGGGVPQTLYHQAKQADIAYLHKATDELYYFARAIIETVILLPKENEDREDLIALLDRAFKTVNWNDDEFYASVEVALENLLKELDNMEKRSKVTVHVVGHTHIDVAWLWRLKHTREKAQRSFATVLRLMERYDEYVFLQTQPQLYKYIKEDCPEMYEQIKKRVDEGRWESDGGMWVEADCNVTSGESLVRQFLHGTRFFEREFNRKCTYLWLPDVFGYSWALPQILNLCEIETFMTTKISWNQYNAIPNDLFRWRGIDGSEILTYFIDTPTEWQEASSNFSTYNGTMNPHSVLGSWNKFKNKELSKDVLVSYGYGDGGGGVNRDMLELRRKMDKIPGLPNVKTDRAGDFFKKIHENVDNTDRYVATWDGELYLEYHRGTYTTQADNKKGNRELENSLLQIEALSSVSYILGGEYAQQKLNDSWECLLLHQFHDIIPGSSIREVYEDSKVNYAKANADVKDAENLAWNSLTKEEKDTYALYSANTFVSDELISIDEEREGNFYLENGEKLVSQKAENGYVVCVPMNCFKGMNILFKEENRENEDTISNVDLNENTIETPFYLIEWTKEGQLKTIFDKDNSVNVLRQGQLGNVLEIYEDKPLCFDAWDIDIFYKEKKEIANLVKPVEVIENGELRTVLRFEYKYNKSTIKQDMIVYKLSRRIDFKTTVDWNEKQRLLKAGFYTDIRSTKATYDIQFGHVERPTHWNTSWDWARFEVCGHKWADLSDNSYGVSLLNNCKYGYSVKDNVMNLSLLKSSKHPDYAADMGIHNFTYAILPHANTFLNENVIEEANKLNLRPVMISDRKWNDTKALVKLDTDRVQIDAVKKAEDENCLVVRMHECRGGRVNFTLSSEFAVKKMVVCNLLERQDGESVEGNEMNISLRPFEIKTVKLYF